MSPSIWGRYRLLPVLVALSGTCAPGAAQQIRADNGRMFWIGSDRTDQFTDTQIEFLLNTASSIVIAQFHAGFDIEAHHELARRVKAKDPTVRIFGYMSGTYIKTRFSWLSDYNDWILRDKDGEPIVHKYRSNGEVAAYFADLSSAAYRKRISEIAAQWMETAPYDGIIFDASNYVHGNVRRTFMNAVPSHFRERTRFRDMISQKKMDAVNAGLETLFRETKAAIGDKLVVWNGFWRKRHTINRSLGLMPLGDVAVAERWSIARPTDPSKPFHAVMTRAEILEDLGIVQQGLAGGKSFFLKDTFDENWYARATPAALEKLARFGWAMYMMIREPGRVSYGFSPGPRYSLNIDSDPVRLDSGGFGVPLGAFEDLGDILKRSFERGVVYMNPTMSPVNITADSTLKLLHGVGIPVTVAAGATVTIPAQDAVFFMSEGQVAQQLDRVPLDRHVDSGPLGLRVARTVPTRFEPRTQ